MVSCFICGQETDWDWQLGDTPLCPSCYDRVIDAQKVATWERYYQNHLEKERERNREYKTTNKETIRQKKRLYSQEHRNEINERKRKNRKLNRFLERELGL